VSLVCTIFRECVQAIRDGELIEREGRQDKEFHFQNWFKARLERTGENFDSPGRNTYPDFKIVRYTEGYELKGLAYPGREADYDCNSQVPCGEHNGRQVFYVFGRYPNQPDGNRYPVLDLILCHGSFLNADNTYIHKNKSFRGFGSYGDILVRDRKMYVAPTPFALAEGTAHRRTLILPADHPVDNDLVEIATLTRREVESMAVAYNFDLRTNELQTSLVPNPNAGREHVFKAYRLTGDSTEMVALRERSREIAELTFQLDNNEAGEE
jgi:hypothetical protein